MATENKVAVRNEQSFKAWLVRPETMVLFGFATAPFVLGLAFILFPGLFFDLLSNRTGIGIAAVISTGFLTVAFFQTSFKDFINRAKAEEKIEAVEQLVRENPEKPQLAWELAQSKLESYLNRNLGQVNSIYRLTVLVMLIGFGFIGFGILKGLESPNNFPVGLLSSISGVVVSFIGGSFLLIFRSTTEQAREYVSVLERINAVGMCVQILDSIPNAHADLKYQARADVALQLLKIYAISKETKLARKVAKVTKKKSTE